MTHSNDDAGRSAKADDVAAIPSAPARLDWADAARGFSVLAVVGFHVWLWHYAPVASAHGWAPAARAWDRVDTLLGSIRVPVLLAVSGLVLSRRLRASGQGHRSWLRAISDYYLYVVWLAVYLAFYAVVRTPDLPHRVDGPLDALRQLVVPDTTLWYLFALAAYIAAMRAVRRVPAWLVLTGTVVLCIGVRAADLTGSFLPKVAESMVFFAAGVYAAEWLRGRAERVTWRQAAACCLLAAAVTVVGGKIPGEYGGSVVYLVRGVVFVFAGVIVISWAVRFALIAQVLVPIGRRTLGIYVLHPLLIALVIVATEHWHGFPRLLGRPVVAALYPPAVLLVVVLAALAIDVALRRARLTALFAMPASLRGRLGTALSRLAP